MATVHLQDNNATRGRVKRTILFHTLEEGVVTAATLNALTGLSVLAARDGLARMRESGLVQWAKHAVTPTTDRRFSGHALTAKGIEAAMTVDRAEVIFVTAEMECH